MILRRKYLRKFYMMRSDFEQTLIPLLYSAHHHGHAPLVEYLHGKTIPYAEQPQRIENIRSALEKSGLVSLVECEDSVPKSAILKAHDAGMVEFLETASGRLNQAMHSDAAAYRPSPDQNYLYPSVFPVRPSMNRLRENARGPHGFYFFDTEAPIGRETWKAASGAASLAYAGAELILSGQTHAAYALCRPPGHHAGIDFMGGYCYMNNAAIAAHHLRAAGEVALIDIDYHHGNGTQSIFWEVPDVLFISLHADPDADYPYYSGYADETGSHGTIINKPLPPRTGETDYLAALDEVTPKIRAFEPRSVVVSLGFDTYQDDPLGTFQLTANTYHEIARRVAAFKLPTLLIQEGGYAVESLGKLAVSFLSGFLAP